MKKWMSILMSALLALSMGTAVAEGGVEPLVGRIVEMRENGDILIEQIEGGSQVQVHVPEALEIEADWEIGVGDVIYVSYSGIMTRSLPPQVTATAIRSHSIEGLVTEANTETGRVLIENAAFGQVWATVPEDTNVAALGGAHVRVFYNGIMAMSFPGQIGAVAIDAMEVSEGVVSEIGDGYFMLGEGDEALRVNTDAHTKALAEYAIGDTVEVHHRMAMAMSLPPQVYAVAVVLAVAE